MGFVHLFAKDAIATQADLKKAKMWLWEGDPLAASFYQHAGVVPVPLAVTDVMTSLQTRLIEAVYSSPLACLALQWFTRVATFTDVPITFASGAVVVSNEAWARIPEAHRATVLGICRKRLAAIGSSTPAGNRSVTEGRAGSPMPAGGLSCARPGGHGTARPTTTRND